MITKINKEACLKILADNYIGHLAYVYKNSPFVVPITYYFNSKNKSLIGYTGEGHKTTALKENNAVALEVEDIESIDNWSTVLVQGTYEELEGPDAKFQLHKFTNGVKEIIAKKEHKEYQFIPQFSDKTHPEAPPIVYRINIEEITGKTRRYS
ncbi:pyridoxamine 5'-phosphate oxidase family protein [Flavobacteriaceae bacterium SZ-1-7]|uniref:pyridoxamine 5'-phosphate oxidase family protein n=1 Tax=Tamlana sedimenti TaxID=3134126 RepID=UPI0031206AAC